MRPAPLIKASALLLLMTVGAAGAQDGAVSAPSTGEVAISGISPERFNPTHGTVFFTLGGAFFPADPRDVAVIIDERQLPVGNLSVSRRIVSASYIMNPGMNLVTLRAWDAAGKVLTTQASVWAGDLTLAVEVADSLGRPVERGELVASLSRDSSVRSIVPIRDGRAEVVNLPDADIRLQATQGSGLEAVAVVPARDRRASLVMR
jgi:hypothetical protein